MAYATHDPKSDASSSRLAAGFGIAGAALLTEYAALGLAYDFNPIRHLSSDVGRIGRITDAAMPVVIVGIAATGLLLVARGAARRITALLRELARERWRLWLHGSAYALLVLLSHVWFGPGRSPTLSPVAAITWLGVGTVTGLTALLIAIPRGIAIHPRSALTVLGALAALSLMTLVVAVGAQLSWAPLQAITLGMVVELSSWAYADLIFRPETAVVGTPHFLVRVAPLCAGLEGIGLMLVMIPAFIWQNRARLRLPRALLLIPLGVLGAWVVNCVRIFLLIVVGTEISPELAVGTFHSRVGWILFALLVVALAGYAVRSPIWSHVAADPDHAEAHDPARPFVAPLVTWVAASVLTGSFAGGLDRLYAVRAIPVLAVLWIYRGDYAPLTRGLSLRRGLGWGLVVLGVWLLLSAPAALPSWMFLSPRQGGAFPEPGWTVPSILLWAAGRTLLSATLVPVVEELAFRGYLLRRLVRREFEEVPFSVGSTLSVLVSSLAFGLLHDAWVAGAVTGGLLAWTQIRTGSLANAVVAHAVANTGVAAYVLLSGDWSQWT